MVSVRDFRRFYSRVKTHKVCKKNREGGVFALDKQLNRENCVICLESGTGLAAASDSVAFRRNLKRLTAAAGAVLEGNRIQLAGRCGGGCAACRRFRREMQLEGIDFTVSCPEERRNPGGGVQIRIGDGFFHKDYLEDDKVLCRYLEAAAADPMDMEAYLALGVIHEYRGQYPLAFGAYWQVCQIDPDSDFARDRLEKIAIFWPTLVRAGREGSNPHGGL